MTWGWLGLAVGSCNATTHNFKGGKEAYIEACGLWTEVHSSLSETAWGPKKLATIGKRLLVILLKRHCLTNLDTGRWGVVMIQQSYKCIWSTCSALCENFLGFIHCILCFELPWLWCGLLMRCSKSHPFLREPQEVTWCKLWTVYSHQLLRYAVVCKMSL